jgi:hypothetical protein
MKQNLFKVSFWWDENVGMYAAKAITPEGNAVVEHATSMAELWENIKFAVHDQELCLFEDEVAPEEES